MQHKWHKEIKALADGAEIEYRNIGFEDWALLTNTKPSWEADEYRIKPQYKEEPYWLCCGCKDPRHNKSCSEAKMGHPERCKFGTASEHFKPQPKDPQYLYVYADGNGITFSGNDFASYEGRLQIGKIKLEEE